MEVNAFAAEWSQVVGMTCAACDYEVEVMEIHAKVDPEDKIEGGVSKIPTNGDDGDGEEN
jgi:hypothetical protein|tara:strand:- start:1622 stop:1801 length:180 start_codon:yes stop_codon:yes gene_type:complete